MAEVARCRLIVSKAMKTSKTIAALVGPTLVAAAISLLANIHISQTIVEELSGSPAVIMMRAIKHALDPMGILNPGKVIIVP